MDRSLAIDFVSPLPPVRSGIADYSRDLLSQLGDLCDLRVIRLPGLPLSEEMERLWHPGSAEGVGEGGRLPLYQMGNNIYHREVLHLALERPGVLTLHDVVLHHLLVEVTLAEQDADAYADHLFADHGWAGRMMAKARQWGELGHSGVFEMAANRTLLRRQRGVLVHNQWAADMVSWDCPEIELHTVPMGVPLPEPAREADRVTWRQRLGLPDSHALLGSFGFQTPIKRTEQVIEALARPELAAAHLVIGGEMHPALGLVERARELGVAERVYCVDYLDYSDFEAMISACDLCVNLRYPTAGETSASLLRVLAVGRPAIVSDYGYSSGLPDEVVIKIPVGEGEVEALASKVGRLVSNRERLAEMSRASRDYVRQNHDPRQAAEAVVEACRKLADREPLDDKPAQPPPPSSLIWRDLAGEIKVEGADPPWMEGESRRVQIRLVNNSRACWLAAGRGPGGVLLEVRWQEEGFGPAKEDHWLELRRDLAPGQERGFELELRRPLGAVELFIEPHLRGVSGFSVFGGPTWLRVL